MTTPDRSTSMIRYGTDSPLPERRMLRAGPVTAMLENGDLRYVRLGNVEIIRRLYIAVRDRNWDTIPAIFSTYRVDDDGDRFRVELAAQHAGGDVDFSWQGSIEGSPDGGIVYALDGAPEKRFLRNRIGFCILHPSALAGMPARTETPDGLVDAVFPEWISPHQPFIDMRSITYPAGPGVEARIAFEGDLFEMEDQRNWTDASFKTYSTPLRIPYPVEVGPEDRVSQRVSLTLTGNVPVGSGSDSGAQLLVTVHPDSRFRLPAIGFGAGRTGTISTGDMARFGALRPAHLWQDLDLGDPAWSEQLEEAASRAAQLDCPLDLSVTASRNEDGWRTLATTIRQLDAPVRTVYVYPAPDDPITFPRSDLATHRETRDAATTAFAAEGVEIQVGGGTRAYFTELNRAMEFLPVSDLERVTYTINAQVHATDTLSVVETLSAQGDTVRSARRLIGDRTLSVGPVTLKPPYNPNATGPPPETPDDALPAAVDSRQLSLFGAAWTVGSLHHLAAAGADDLTYYELYGWRGLSERRQDLTRRARFPSEPGQLFPLYHVFAAIADFAGGECLAVESSDPLRVEALAVRKGQDVRILLASFQDTSTDVTLEGVEMRDANVRMLDETTWEDAGGDPAFSREGGIALEIADGTATVSLLPFGVACIAGRVP